jgi:hypothetical protein
MPRLFWNLLTVPERRCLAQLSMDEPLANMPGVGAKSIQRLMELGLIEESPNTPLGGDRRYRRTDKGKRTYEAMLSANRIPPRSLRR